MEHAYNELYTEDVINEQGCFFMVVVRDFPDHSFLRFVKDYMKSELRSEIDIAWPKAAALRALELRNRYIYKEGYVFKGEPDVRSLDMAEWIGRFYAYYQWYWNVKSARLVDWAPPEHLCLMYPGAHSQNMISVIKAVPPDTLPGYTPAK